MTSGRRAKARRQADTTRQSAALQALEDRRRRQILWGGVVGLVVLAAVGVGWYSSVDDACAVMVRATPVAQPGADRTTYRAGHEIYRSLYPTLADSFHRLAEA